MALRWMRYDCCGGWDGISSRLDVVGVDSLSTTIVVHSHQQY